MYGNNASKVVYGTADQAGTFAFIPYEKEGVTHHYLFCVEQQKFVTHDDNVYPDKVGSTGNASQLSTDRLHAIADVQVNALASPQNEYTANMKSGDLMLNMSSSTVYFNKWTSADEGNRLAIVEAADFSADAQAAAKAMLDYYFNTPKYTVTYNIDFYGSTLTQTSTYLLEGTAMPVPNVPDYVTFIPTEDVPETVTSDMTINGKGVLNTTDTDKLRISTSVNGEGAIPFAMKNRTTRWVYTESGRTDYIHTEPIAPTPDTKNSYLWTIVGNWVDGYNIYNVSEGKYLTNDKPTQLSDTPGKFLLKKANSGGWGFVQMNGTNIIGSHNDGNKQMSHWNWGNPDTDDGSRHIIFSNDDLDDLIIAEPKGKVESALASKGYVFGLTETVAAALQGKYDELVAANNKDYATWTALAAECEAAESVELAEGYYRFRNANYPTFFMAFTDRMKAVENVNDASTIIKVTAMGEGTYSMSLQGQYIQAAAGQGSGGYQVLLGEEPVVYQITRQNFGHAVFSTSGANYTFIHCAGGKNLVGWQSAATASQWNMTPAETIDLALNGMYTTAYLPFSVVLDASSDIEVYTLNGSTTEGDNTYAQGVKIGNKIPAGTPVLIVNKGEATSVTARIKAVDTPIEAGSLLSGQYLNSIATVTVNDTEVSAAATQTIATTGDFVAGTSADDETVYGFFPMTEDGTPAANSAFIAAAQLEGINSLLLDTEKLNPQPILPALKTITIASKRGALYGSDDSRLKGTKDGTPGNFVLIPYTVDETEHTYMYSVEQKAFVIHNAADYPNNITGNNNKMLLSKTDFSIIADIQVNDLETPDGEYTKSITSGDYMLNTNSAGDVVINTWKDADDGNRLAIVEGEEFPTEDLAEAIAMLDKYFNTPKYTVTYNIDFNGTTLTKTFGNLMEGASVPAVDVPSYITFTATGDVPETVTGDLTINGTAVLNTTDDKLAISASVSGEGVVKMAMKNRGNSKWIFAKDGVTETVGDAATNPTVESKDNYLWVITGNWIDGYSIYNVGQQKYLTNDAPTQLSDEAGKFLLKKEEGGWGFLQTNNSNVLGDHNAQNGTLGIWSGSANTSDPGSLTVIYAENDLDDIFVSSIKSNVESALASKGAVFGLTEEAANSLQTEHDALVEAENNTYDAWKALSDKCNEAETIELAEGYYRLENCNYPGWYMGFTDKLAAIQDANNPSTIVKVSNLGEGKWSLGIQGQFVQAAAGQGSGGYQTLLGTETAEYIVGKAAWGKTTFTVTEAAQGYLHCAGGKDILGWGPTATASQWRMIPAESIELALDGTYSTTYLPFAVALDETQGIEAYTVTGTAEKDGSNYALTTEVGSTIPAGTPVVLYNGEGAASVTATILSTADAIEGEQLLNGQYLGAIAYVTVQGESVPAAEQGVSSMNGDLVIGKSADDESVYGFFPMGMTDLPVANTAYFPFLKAQGIRALLLNKEVWTGINGVKADATEGEEVIYDLSGRRVQKAVKGIYIINGKKVIK